jgi:hypothetical protein
MNQEYYMVLGLELSKDLRVSIIITTSHYQIKMKEIMNVTEHQMGTL